MTKSPLEHRESETNCFAKTWRLNLQVKDIIKMKISNHKTYDVAVIGGGPAGMMTAIRAAEMGASVVLVEKNKRLGEKLLITGGGRCNITNAEFDIRKFAEKLGEKGKFLLSPLSKFGAKETINFFNLRNLPTKEEDNGRVFPASDSSKDVLNILINEMRKKRVKIILGYPILSLEKTKGKITAAKTSKGKIIAKSFVLATGGKSRPETGSTGDGFNWMKEIGHKVIDPKPSLVPVKIKENWVKDAKGISLPEVKTTLLQNGKKQKSITGKIIFTHFGLSGPAILNLSKDIGELVKYGKVEISLDLFPVLDNGSMDKKIQELFKNAPNKKIKNLLDEIIPSKLAPKIIEIANINPEKEANSITREERIALGKTLKDIRITVTGLLGFDKAIITSGGISLDEVDFKAMRSRLVSNLYFTGDILDFDRPSGGYSLQICWTTGFVAGENSFEK